MTFQRARTQEQVSARKGEIIDACRQIYTAEGYDAITMEKISKLTSISRASLYNYYTTKEEIVLDLLLACHLKFAEELQTELDKHETLSKEEFCEILAKISSEQETFWSLNSIHLLGESSRTSLRSRRMTSYF